MKKFILILTLALMSVCTYAQTPVVKATNPTLDQHRNFKEIKLGDTKAKWASSLNFIETINGTSTYRVNTNSCCSTIFNEEVEALHVFIKQDKIVGIEVAPFKIQRGSKYGEMTNIDKGFAKFDSFKSKFSTLFGEPYTVAHKEDGNTIKVAQWVGNSTFLELTYEYYGVVNGDRVIVVIWDLNYLKGNLESGF